VLAIMSLTLSAWLLLASPLPAQNLDDPPQVLKPAHAATKKELDRLEALKRFGQAVRCEKSNRLLEAVKLYEDAARLDPESAAAPRALLHLYMALDRVEDAFRTCEKVMKLDPDDHETAYIYARHLKALDRGAEAKVVLVKLAGRKNLGERPELKAQIHHDLGAIYEADSEWAKAEASFRKVAAVLDEPAPLIEHGPYNREEIAAQAAEIYERIGRLCLKQKQADRAVAAFDQAGKKDPSRAPRLAFNLAEVLVSEGQPRAALERVDEYLRSQPPSLEGYELRIDLQRKLGLENKIIPDLQKAAEQDAHNVGLHLLLGRTCRKEGKPDEARKVYDDLIKQSEYGPDVFRGLFDLCKDRGKAGGREALLLLNDAVSKASGVDGKDDADHEERADAAAAAQARSMLIVLRDDPELVKAMLPEANQLLLAGDKTLSYRTRMGLAVLAERTHQLDVAEALYRSCLERRGGPSAEMEHNVYAGLLTVLERAHKSAEIVALCNDGLQKAGWTNRVMFHMDKAYALLALGNDAEAVEAVEAAVKDAAEADRLRCRLARAQVLSQVGRTRDAIAECQQLLKDYNQAKDERGIRLTTANIYSAARDWSASEEQLQKVLEADPNDATANNDLGYQWADQNKNLEEAEQLIRKALDLDRRQRNSGGSLATDADQDAAAYVDSLGWVLFRRGKFDEARKEMERAAALPGGLDDPTVWDHLGDVYYRLKEIDKARTAWRKSLELYDAGRRRKTDERYKEIQDKLRLEEP
jgi:tetratricopeptide (TPR) repeat protein